MPNAPDTKHCVARVHGTTISWQGNGALLIGASGSGKSSLALHLMALGCDLVADDQTELSSENGVLIATCPKTIAGSIEARGFGILNAKHCPQAILKCCVDLDHDELDRLPHERFTEFCNVPLRLFHKTGIEVLPFALLQYLRQQ